MKRLIIIAIITITFCGCSYFATGKRLKECNSLLDQSKTQLIEAVSIIDSLQMELDKCQKIKE